MDLSHRLVEHDHWHTARLIEQAATLSDEALDRPVQHLDRRAHIALTAPPIPPEALSVPRRSIPVVDAVARRALSHGAWRRTRWKHAGAVPLATLRASALRPFSAVHRQSSGPSAAIEA